MLSLEVEAIMVLAISLASILILFVFSMLRIPSSLSLITVGASMGAILGLNLTLEANYVMMLVASWLLLPLLSVFLTMFAYQPITMFVSKFSLAGADLITRLSATLGIFILSYVLGANNVGFINGLYAPLLSQPTQGIISLATSVSTIIGVVLFGRAITEVIGERFVVLSPQGVFTSMIVSAACVWVFTQAGIPVSITYMLIGSIVGAALVKRIAILNLRVLGGIVRGATGSILLSCIFAFFITRILFR
jgi:PiT family inorganic phosphate transporter